MIRPTRHWPVLLVATLWGLVAVGGTGCCVYRPGGPIDPCGPNDTGVRSLTGRGAPGDSCGGCSSCGGSCGRQKGQIAACKWGCGEVYWDEWLSDPPDCCDPCDACGNWAGPQACCKPSILQKFADALWGCRGEPCSDGECCEKRGGWCNGSSCSAGGCSSCTDRAGWVPVEEGVQMLPSPPEPESDAPPSPKPAMKAEPKAKRPARPYHPSYTRPASYQR